MQSTLTQKIKNPTNTLDPPKAICRYAPLASSKTINTIKTARVRLREHTLHEMFRLVYKKSQCHRAKTNSSIPERSKGCVVSSFQELSQNRMNRISWLRGNPVWTTPHQTSVGHDGGYQNFTSKLRKTFDSQKKLPSPLLFLQTNDDGITYTDKIQGAADLKEYYGHTAILRCEALRYGADDRSTWLWLFRWGRRRSAVPDLRKVNR